MPGEPKNAEEFPRRQPRLAALRALREPRHFVRAIPVEEDGASPDEVVVPLRREGARLNPQTSPVEVRIPRREPSQTPEAQDASLFPRRLRPSANLPRGSFVVPPAESVPPRRLPSPPSPQTAGQSPLERPLPERALVDAEPRPTVAGRGVKRSLDSQPHWYQTMVITFHVVPWVLFVLVAFGLLPSAWRFERWPGYLQTGATVGFGLFIVADAAFALWYVAFRKGGRDLD